jgi:hypothetical protein
MLKLKPFIKEIQNEIYCIVKKPENFPEYYKGSDLDIFCYDIQSITKKLIAVGTTFVSSDYEIKLTNNNYQQVYVDFVLSGSIEFRFDLYSQLPDYKNVNITPALFESIIENRIKIKIDRNIYYFVPNKIDESIIRYLEYHEWYKQRPDKIKHIDYILSHLTQNEMITFLAKLHHYTALPKYLDNVGGRKQSDKNRIIQLLKTAYHKSSEFAKLAKTRIVR